MSAIMVAALLSFVPADLEPWYSMCREGNWEAASEEAFELLELDPGNDDAEAALAISSALDPRSHDVRSFVPGAATSLTSAAMGAILISDRRSELLEDARIHLILSLDEDPGNVLSWHLMGVLLTGLGDRETAAGSFREAASLDPGFIPAGLEYSRVLRDLRMGQDALEEFGSVMGTATPAGRLAMAEYILLAASLDTAADAESLEVSLLDSEPDAWLELAFDQLHIRPAVAREAAGRVPEGKFSPDLAGLYLELGDLSEAVRLSRDLLEAGSADSVQVLRILGRALFEIGDETAARNVYERLLEARPADTDAMVHLGRLAEGRGRTAEATDLYLRALAVDVHNTVARSRLREMAGEAYDPEEMAREATGFSLSAGADLSLERGNRALLEWGGSISASYRFDRRGTSVEGHYGGRSVTWEEFYGPRTDTLTTGRGWGGLAFEYWLADSYFLKASSRWDRQMYTERPWQISSYCAAGWRKLVHPWLLFSPRAGAGLVNARWSSGDAQTLKDDFSIYAAVDLEYARRHTFVRMAEISGEVYFPPDDPQSFISSGRVYLAFRTWNPLYIALAYSVDYTRMPEVPTWSKFNTSFTTSLNLDLF